jgi:hypothetical protein
MKRKYEGRHKEGRENKNEGRSTVKVRRSNKEQNSNRNNIFNINNYLLYLLLPFVLGPLASFPSELIWSCET